MFKIYVGNLDYKVKVEQLRELFAVLGPIEDLVIPTDPKTNKPKGFAIVMIRDPEIGHAAIKAMQGKRLMGRALVVNEAIKKKKSATLPTKEQVIRNGPFGPRMNRFGDPRAAGSRPSRNPRRSGPAVSRGSQTGFQSGPPPASSPVPQPGVHPRSAPGPHSGASGSAPTGTPMPTANGAGTPPAVPSVPFGAKPPTQGPPPSVPRPADGIGAARSAASPKATPSSTPSASEPPTPPRPKAQRLSAPRPGGTDADPKSTS